MEVPNSSTSGALQLPLCWLVGLYMPFCTSRVSQITCKLKQFFSPKFVTTLKWIQYPLQNKLDKKITVLKQNKQYIYRLLPIYSLDASLQDPSLAHLCFSLGQPGSTHACCKMSNLLPSHIHRRFRILWSLFYFFPQKNESYIRNQQKEGRGRG